MSDGTVECPLHRLVERDGDSLDLLRLFAIRLVEREPPSEKEVVRGDDDLGELIDDTEIDEVSRLDACFLPQLTASGLRRVFVLFHPSGEGFEGVAIEGVAIDANEVDRAVIVDREDGDTRFHLHYAEGTLLPIWLDHPVLADRYPRVAELDGAVQDRPLPSFLTHLRHPSQTSRNQAGSSLPAAGQT